MGHDGEVDTDVDLVRRLVAAQFPRWSHLAVAALPPVGTDHALYRLGDGLVVRMPRIDWAVDQAASDERWLPLLAPHLPLAVPVPLGVGAPGEGYPWPWSVVPWFAGENPSAHNLDLDLVAVQLAGFVAALHRVGTAGGPVKTGTTRGVPLAARDEITRKAIGELGDRVDAPALLEIWDDALAARPWTGLGVWIHGDLEPGNLLVRDRRLVAVIDFGGLGLGDPAADLLPAWSVFDPPSRWVFRRALGCDEDTWRRGRGWALSTAVIALAYYWDSGTAIVAASKAKLAALQSVPA